jgi:hypothetical protein
MSARKAVAIVSLACLAIAAAIYAYAYLRSSHTTTDPSSTSTPLSKIPSADLDDGTYVARIHSITTHGEDAYITFEHVNYYEGVEASTTASRDIDCPDSRPIEACAPTLTKGFYVRESDTPNFTAPITAQTSISLRGEETASLATLSDLQRQFDPVFEVIIRNGAIASLIEKSPE